MNKQIRKEREYLKYKKRIEKFCYGIDIYFTRDGIEIKNPKPIDVIKDRGQYVYKSTSTPCSCYCCSGYYKYRRHDKKKEDRNLIYEWLID